ncbi:hypothetical protein NW759_009640 [Fusarium solani]|nr:hypothetical protein NW759_009640 [Fusarium solani]
MLFLLFIIIFFFVLFLFLIFIPLAFILFFLVVPVLFIFFFLTLFLPFLLFLLFFLGGRSSSGSFPFSPLLLERLIQLVPELVHSSFVAAACSGWHFADCVVIVVVFGWSSL